MTEKKRPIPKSEGDRKPERVEDPDEAMQRLRAALRHILKVPKAVVQEDR